jgi:hypothetical protein
MTNEKVVVVKETKKDVLTEILNCDAVQKNEKWKKCIAHEIELLEKKTGANRKPTKVQKENLEIAKVVLSVFEKNPNTLYRVTELVKVEILADYSSQKIAPIVKTLVSNGNVKVVEEKGVNYYQYNGATE